MTTDNEENPTGACKRLRHGSAAANQSVYLCVPYLLRHFFRISAQNTLDKTLMLTKIMSRSYCEVSIHKRIQIQFKTDFLKGKTQWKIKPHNFPGRP